jgi:deoxyadenosine/deoxycytidine kinase
MHVIEFFGMPGSGKSTILRFVRNALKRRLSNVLDEDEAFYYSFASSQKSHLVSTILNILTTTRISYKVLRLYLNRFVVGPDKAKALTASASENFIKQRPDLYNLILRQIDDNYQYNGYRKLLKLWFVDLIAKYQIFEDYLPSRTILIADEWFIHEALCCFVPGKDLSANRGLTQYINLVPKSDVIIYVEAELPQCLSRINARRNGHIFINNLHGPEKIKYLENNQKTAEYINYQLKDVIKIENKSTVENLISTVNENVERIREAISSSSLKL